VPTCDLLVYHDFSDNLNDRLDIGDDAGAKEACVEANLAHVVARGELEQEALHVSEVDRAAAVEHVVRDVTAHGEDPAVDIDTPAGCLRGLGDGRCVVGARAVRPDEDRGAVGDLDLPGEPLPGVRLNPALDVGRNPGIQVQAGEGTLRH
jgi:hypothetical protein